MKSVQTTSNNQSTTAAIAGVTTTAAFAGVKYAAEVIFWDREFHAPAVMAVAKDKKAFDEKLKKYNIIITQIKTYDDPLEALKHEYNDMREAVLEGLSRNKKIWMQELWPAIENRDQKALDEVLQKYKITINLFHLENGTPLEYALNTGNVIALFFALANGADLNSPSYLLESQDNSRFEKFKNNWLRATLQLYYSLNGLDSLKSTFESKELFRQIIDILTIFRMKFDYAPSVEPELIPHVIPAIFLGLSKKQEEEYSKIESNEIDAFLQTVPNILKTTAEEMERDNSTIMQSMLNQYDFNLIQFISINPLRKMIISYIPQSDFNKIILLSRADLRRSQAIINMTQNNMSKEEIEKELSKSNAPNTFFSYRPVLWTSVNATNTAGTVTTATNAVSASVTNIPTTAAAATSTSIMENSSIATINKINF